MMKAETWFRFFPSDWLAGTAGLSAGERGVYITLVAMMYDQNGPIKRDDARLARRCGLPIFSLRRALSELMALGKIEQSGEMMINFRVSMELNFRSEFVAHRKRGAILTNQKRYGKSKGATSLSDRTANAQRFQPASLPIPIPNNIESLTTLSSTDEPLTAESPVEKVKAKKELSAEKRELIMAVAEAWNELAAAHRLAQIEDITPKRQSAILARARDLVSTYDFPDAETGFRELLGRIRGSPFLRGEINGFRANFDFITKQSSFTKIMEGTYEGQEKHHHDRRQLRAGDHI